MATFVFKHHRGCNREMYKLPTETCSVIQTTHTLPKAMDFNEIISVDLKELHPEYRKDGYKYILYIIDKFSKYMKGVLVKEKEAETVVTAVYRHWVIGVNGLGFGSPTCVQ